VSGDSIALATLVLTLVAGTVAAIKLFINLGGLVKDLQHGQSDHDTAIKDIRHDLRNDRTRIDALEHLRQGDIERIVRLETSFNNVEKSLDRIERSQADAFDALSTSIREIRIVAPKG
jgi:hypothetical protein